MAKKDAMKEFFGSELGSHFRGARQPIQNGNVRTMVADSFTMNGERYQKGEMVGINPLSGNIWRA